MPPKEQSEPTRKTFQVWHEGKSHAVDVESVGVREVWTLTRKSPERWKDDPGVKIHAESPRPTKVGDVIVDPTCGAWEVQKDRFLAVEPPEPVAERMAREGIVPQHIRLLHEWTESMLSALDSRRTERPPGEKAQTPVEDCQAETERMKCELAEPTSDYQQALDAASRRGTSPAKEKGPER